MSPPRLGPWSGVAHLTESGAGYIDVQAMAWRVEVAVVDLDFDDPTSSEHRLHRVSGFVYRDLDSAVFGGR
ncbi:hypothetical protein [Rhodococcoides fascians]|uniref:hypothetical protein n=1 Tax=Rhodococcoides fascians TaxID=1828 RepID=UPI001114962D|nr:hypothetical protein [Rhodococcus fascians]